MSIQQRQKQLIEEFSKIDSWEQRYQKIIEMGRAMPSLPDEKKTETHKVKGCQSQVWLHARMSDEGKIIFEADSDALIVKGLVALLLRIYSDSTPKEILTTPPDFIKGLGLEGKLSPSRANGLFSMFKQILNYARAFAMITQS